MWIGLVVAAGVLFLPWLPIAIRQINTRPSARVAIDGGQMLLDTLRLYVAGPTLPAVEATGAILVCGFFILIGLWNPIGFDERRAEAHEVPPYSIRLGSIVLWWLVPIALIFAFGLFKESYLKFFIVGSAAFCILLAKGIAAAWGIGRGALKMPRELAGRPVASWAWSIVVLALCAVIAVPTFNALRNYYWVPVPAPGRPSSWTAERTTFTTLPLSDLHGHTPGPMAVRSEPPNRNFPCTLDLRYARRE